MVQLLNFRMCWAFQMLTGKAPEKCSPLPTLQIRTGSSTCLAKSHTYVTSDHPTIPLKLSHIYSAPILGFKIQQYNLNISTLSVRLSIHLSTPYHYIEYPIALHSCILFHLWIYHSLSHQFPFKLCVTYRLSQW